MYLTNLAHHHHNKYVNTAVLLCQQYERLR